MDHFQSENAPMTAIAAPRERPRLAAAEMMAAQMNMHYKYFTRKYITYNLLAAFHVLDGQSGRLSGPGRWQN
jgi:hypothetical protein